MDKFHVDVETRYLDDAGIQENIFELSDDELKNRVVGEWQKFDESKVQRSCKWQQANFYRLDFSKTL